MRRLPASVATVLVVAAGATSARSQTFDRVSLTTSMSVDHFDGDNAADRPNIVIDVMATVRLGAGWEVYVRPWFRQPRRAGWDAFIYQAALRWERPGPVALRLDAGYLVSPIGLGLFDSSPSVNPTILPHLGYFVPMPLFDVTAPRMPAVSSTYPLGAELSASTERWDARVALVDSAPTRLNVVGASARPRSTPVVEAGAGITPKTGLRLGVSMASGAYATSEEVRSLPDADRRLLLTGIEAEYAFRYTKLAAEYIHDRFTTPFGTATADAWFLQGHQTISPRWFLAARQERIAAPPLPNGIVPGTPSHMTTTEVTVGYRISRGVTVRGGYYGRKNFSAPGWDHQGGASIVWAERWR